MTSWGAFAAAEPDLARLVQDLLENQKHMTLATLRRDGSPRISGTEATIVDGELVLGMMSGSVKARDLLGDPRLALHGPTPDPPVDDPSSWVGMRRSRDVQSRSPTRSQAMRRIGFAST